MGTMTSSVSIKPEVDNVSQRRQRRTEPKRRNWTHGFEDVLADSILTYIPTDTLITVLRSLRKTKEPLLEVAPTTLAQRTRQTSEIRSRRSVLPQPKRNMFVQLLWTSTYDSDIRTSSTQSRWNGNFWTKRSPTETLGATIHLDPSCHMPTVRQRSFSLKVTFRTVHTDTHRTYCLIALPESLRWSVWLGNKPPCA